jgi:hypothetical protein
MSDYSDRVLATNPIAFYRLNDTVLPTTVDSTTNGFDSVYLNSPVLASVVGPDGVLVPSFNGTTHNINLSASGLLGTFDPTNFSINIWIKVNNWTDGAFREVLVIRRNASNQIRLRKLDTNNTFEVSYEAGGINKVVTKAGLTSNDWIMVTLTVNTGADEMIVSFDGVAEPTVNGLGVWAGVASSAYIGSFLNVANWWTNSLALAAFWNIVLTPAQVTALFDTSSTAVVTPAPHIPQALYDILVYDHTGTLQLFLQKWSRLEFHQRLNAPWNHQITLEYGYDDPDLATIRNILNDWIIEVYRIDPVTLVRTKVYEGFNVTIVDQVRANGGIILNLYGVGYTQLLQRRIVVPPAGQEYATKTGLAESVIKSFVADSMVSPLDANRIFNGVTVAADSGAGNIITFSARYTNLLSVCETVSEQGNLDYGIIGGSEVGEFIFDARGLWGNDYREGNTAGNIPIIFSIERDNMLIPILSLNYSAEQNFMYVGGEGQGAERVIQEVQNSVAIATSPWGRKESFAESRSQNSVDALVAAGQTELEARKAKQSLSFSIRQTDSSRWIRDWNLGDLITAKYYEYAFDRQIVDIGVLVSSGASNYETITVKFEDLRI